VKTAFCRGSVLLAVMFLAVGSASAGDAERDLLILSSTNNPAGNEVVVFKLDRSGAPSLTFVSALATGGNGGASGNAGILQFRGELGAVGNFGSNTVSQLVRNGDSISLGQTITLAQGCTHPDSVALTSHHLFVVGANCAESHNWPSGDLDGEVVRLADSSAGQIAIGVTWGAITLTSGSLLQLSLTDDGALSGSSVTVPLPSNASNTPLGAAFWRNVLGFTPAHSVDSFAIVDEKQSVFPILGPTPSYPTNAPCWVAKGPGNVWYTANSPGQAVSIFFSDAQGGSFYKSIPLPGTPTDLAVSHDSRWLAVIYAAADGSGARLAVFAIDDYGDLSLVATSSPIGVTAFSGVAFSR